MVERQGQVQAQVVPDSRRIVCCGPVTKSASFLARSSTPTSRSSYLSLTRDGYGHSSLPARPEDLRPRGRPHEHRGRLLRLAEKRPGSAHITRVSPHRLETYVNEYVWRYNHRDDDEAQFLYAPADSASQLG